LDKRKRKAGRLAVMRKVLFVDDDQHVLDGLQRTLRPQTQEWEMAFAQGGETALAMLDCTPFDVIVTDMRMPGMDGAELLEKVRRRTPQVVRIILSGYVDLQATFRAVPVAHQFLMKPCDAGTLRVAIERACSLQGILNDGALARMVGTLGDLPSAPRVYTALLEALKDPETSLQQVALIVEQDVAISAKVLQLVNSAFFGLTRNITAVSQAVNYLGINVLQSLVATAEAFRAFQQVQQIEGFSIDEFQEHAQLAVRVSGLFSLPRHLADSASMASLLHDVGKLVLASRLPREFGKAIALAREQKQPLYRMEQDLFGVSHAEIGAYLLGLWGLPSFVTEAVAHHHAPMRVIHRSLDAVGVVYLADHLAHCARPSAFGLASEPVDEAFLREMGIAEQYFAWEQEAREMGKDFAGPRGRA
jgi:HD-like signal output (HDOD) protein/CheY-like chemotaxis protein